MDLGRTADAVMRRFAGPAVFAMALAGAAPAAAQGEVTPLFADETPLDVTITGPIRSIARAAERSTDPRPATLVAGGETHPIMLSARGFSRRTSGSCDFPPLRVELTDNPGAGSLFDKQKKLKLVVHCRDSDTYEQYTLREYAIYKLYNLLSPDSFKVRLLKVRYMDDDKQVAQRWGFFIEDIGDLARRMGGEQIELSRIPSGALDPEDAARTATFQYMVANADWEMVAGPEGEDCCHNAKLVGASADALKAITPVPYDFDYTGLVNTPYALPAEAWRINSVRTRYYWGFCAHNSEVLRLAPEFRAARPQLEAEIARIPGLSERSRTDMVKYLGGFFDDIATDREIEKNLFKTCRN
jgi:hypothetical protein